MHTLWNVSSWGNAQLTRLGELSSFCSSSPTKVGWVKKVTQRKRKTYLLFLPHTHDSHQPAVLLSVDASVGAVKCYALLISLLFFSICHISKDHFSHNNSGPNLLRTFTATASTKQQMVSFWKKKQKLRISIKRLTVSFSFQHQHLLQRLESYSNETETTLRNNAKDKHETKESNRTVCSGQPAVLNIAMHFVVYKVFLSGQRTVLLFSFLGVCIWHCLIMLPI